MSGDDNSSVGVPVDLEELDPQPIPLTEPLAPNLVLPTGKRVKLTQEACSEIEKLSKSTAKTPAEGHVLMNFALEFPKPAPDPRVEDLEHQIAEMKEKIRELEDRLAKQNEKSLKEEVRKSTARLRSAQENLEKVSQELEDEGAERKKRIDEADEKIKELEQKVKCFEEKVKIADEKIKTYGAEIKIAAKKINDLAQKKRGADREQVKAAKKDQETKQKAREDQERKAKERAKGKEQKDNLDSEVVVLEGRGPGFTGMAPTLAGASRSAVAGPSKLSRAHRMGAKQDSTGKTASSTEKEPPRTSQGLDKSASGEGLGANTREPVTFVCPRCEEFCDHQFEVVKAHMKNCPKRKNRTQN